jgi:hypothetical protein
MYDRGSILQPLIGIPGAAVSSHLVFEPPTALDESDLCAARLQGADAALTLAPEATGQSDLAAPELVRRCDADLSIHTLTLEIVPTGLLASLGPGGLSTVHAVLAAAWEEGRDAVWDAAVQAVRLRQAGHVCEAFMIERANENYVDSLRASIAAPDAEPVDAG